MSTVRAALAEACRHLAEVTPSARIDADCLLQHVLKKDRAWLRTHDGAALSTDESAAFDDCIKRRLRGEPIAYITGARGFWSLELQVGPGVLIPRPETELLVERALELIPALSALRVLDLGTGSGAIALAVKKERLRCEVTAVDASPAALEIAAANAQRLGLAVTLRESDWFSALAGETFDIVLSNPPYIAPDDEHLVQGDLRFEPRGALAADEAGLQALRHIAETTPSHLSAGGWLLMEHGYEQGAAVRALFAQQGFAQITTRRDLSGHERFTEGCLSC